MKLKHIILGLFCLLSSGLLFAQGALEAVENSDQSAKSPFKPDSLHGLFSYTDFDFDNSTPFLLSKFQGHSYLTLVGGNNFHISSNTNAGIFFYNLYTDLSFTQSLISVTSETIKNNSVFGHVIRQVKPSFALDLLGGYGQNSLNFNTTSSLTPVSVGNAKGSGNNWFVSLKGMYSHSWTDFGLLASLGVLHTEVNQSPFYFFLNANPVAPIFVDSLLSRQSFVLEYAELTYKKYPKIQPFVNAGLLQVIQYSNVTPGAVALSAATLPNSTVNLNVNGYSVGAGLSLQHKQWLLRLEQQYYQRGSIFHSNQSIASIRYLI